MENLSTENLSELTKISLKYLQEQGKTPLLSEVFFDGLKFPVKVVSPDGKIIGTIGDK